MSSLNLTVHRIIHQTLRRHRHRFHISIPALPHQWSLLPIVLLMLLALVLVVLAYQRIGSLSLAIGPGDLRFVSGAHEQETLTENGRTMRWTTGETRLDLPLVAAHTPLILDLNLVNGYPAGVDDPVLDVRLDTQAIVQMVPRRESRHYRLLLPPQERVGWNVPILLHSTTIMPPNDPRPLGVVLVGVTLSAATTGVLLPPLWQIVALMLLGAGASIALRGVGASGWLAWLLSVVLLLAVGHILAHMPMQVAPFTMRLAGLAWLGALYGSFVRLLTESLENRPWVSATSLLLMMGLACWLMPAYQLIMSADGAEAVMPYLPTLWIGGALLAALVVGMVVLVAIGRTGYWRELLLVLLALASVAHLVIMLEFVMSARDTYITGVSIRGVAAICIGTGLLVVALSPYVRLLPLAIIGGVAVAAVVFLCNMFDPWIGRSGPDFWILFRGARDWFRGGSLYDLVAVKTNHFGHVFKVPPFYGMLFVPFVQQDGLTILYWHRVINMLLVSLILVVMVRSFKIPLLSVLGVGLLMIVTMRPLADTVAYGQIDIMLLLLLTLALVASQRQHDMLAGAAVALGTLFKLYPVLLLAFFVAKRQWRALIGFALAMIICNGIAIAVMGWEMHRIYLFEVVPRIGGGTAWVENQTLNGFLSRVYAPDMSASIFVHPLVTLLTYLFAGLATLGATYLAWQGAERDSPRYMLQFSTFVILMVLVVPAAWMHYQTIVILAFVSILVYAGDLGLFRWGAALTGVAYALIAYGNQWSFYGNKTMGILTVTGISYKFYGLILLLAVVVGCLYDSADQQAPSDLGQALPSWASSLQWGRGGEIR